jgi:hypothetical protein
LDGVEGKSGFKHAKMNVGILMAGKSDETDFAILLGFVERFGSASFSDEKVRIIVEGHAVHLPEIEMIGLQTPKRLLQHEQGKAAIATVRASFCHEKNFVTVAFEARAHPDFSLAAAILPAIVVEGDSTVDGLMNDLDCSFCVRSFAKVVTTESERRNLCFRATELPERDGSAGSLWHRFPSSLPEIGKYESLRMRRPKERLTGKWREESVRE